VKTRPHNAALLLAGCLANPFPTAPEGRPPAPGTEHAWTEGHKLYDAACARCHGPEGQGVAGRGVTLRGLRLGDEELRAYVRSGKAGHMPPKAATP
jgi:mono/diheme cytochrome c family protein